MTYSRSIRHDVFDLLCVGVPLVYAVQRVGVSPRQATDWWRQAGGMALSREFTPAARGAERPGGRGHRLSLEERITIMRGRDRGQGCAEIGRQIGRDKSVVWREVRRNADPEGDYHAGLADRRAAVKARRPKVCKLADPELRERVTEWMDQGWSPQLIAQVLAGEHDRLRRVSHETIYQSLYVQTRGHLRADLHKCLSTKRAARKRRGETAGRGPYAEAFRISDRPAEVADRAVPGHWEGDLIMGAVGCGAIGTLVERSTRFTILLHLPHGHGAEEVAAVMITAMQDLPTHLRRTITWDRGIELARYRDIEMQLEAPVYFCDPHAPWQRGTNENTNRLLRFWFAKSSDLRVHTAADLKRVQDLLNTRPRPTLDLDTPAKRLHNLIEQAA